MQANNVSDVANSMIAQELKAIAYAGFAAGTDQTELVIGTVGPCNSQVQIGAMAITPNAGQTLTANASNYVTITVWKRTAAAPATQVVLATLTTQLVAAGGTGNWVAFVPPLFTIAAGASVGPGDVISWAQTHTGSGVLTPPGTIEIFGKLN